MKEIRVPCPCCRNKRLFDADPHTEGNIQIKCPICKSVIEISLHNQKIVAEKMDVNEGI